MSALEGLNFISLQNVLPVWIIHYLKKQKEKDLPNSLNFALSLLYSVQNFCQISWTLRNKEVSPTNANFLTPDTYWHLNLTGDAVHTLPHKKE